MGIHTEKNTLLIPYWIANTLLRNQLPLSTILNFNKLKEIVSPDDLAIISLLNKENQRVFGSKQYSPVLFTNWYLGSDGVNKYESQIKPLEDLVKEDLESRLFNKASFNERYATPFEIKDIDFNTILIIVYPGYFGGQEYKTHQLNLIKELLRLFYVVEGFDDMAQRQIFEYYLEQL